MSNDDKEFIELSQQTPLELEKLSEDERQVRALKIERHGLARRGLDDRVKEIDAQLKSYADADKKTGRKANSTTADSTPLETREA